MNFSGKYSIRSKNASKAKILTKLCKEFPLQYKFNPQYLSGVQEILIFFAYDE